MVRDLNVVGIIGDEAMESGDGAFGDGEGRVTNSKGEQRAREPDHRMWAVRVITLKEGRDGTKGEDDYQVRHDFLFSSADDVQAGELISGE